jgi:hypothetical protein
MRPVWPTPCASMRSAASVKYLSESFLPAFTNQDPDHASIRSLGRFAVPCMLMSGQTRCCNLIDGLCKFGHGCQKWPGEIGQPCR